MFGLVIESRENVEVIGPIRRIQKIAFRKPSRRCSSIDEPVTLCTPLTSRSATRDRPVVRNKLFQSPLEKWPCACYTQSKCPSVDLNEKRLEQGSPWRRDSMRKVLPFVVGLAFLSAVPAKAEPVLFSAILQGTNENPVNASTGLGFALVRHDAAAHTLSVLAGFDDLLAGVTAAHIHCCAAAPANAGVATTTPTFPGFPSAVTMGFYSQIFDLTMATSFNPAFIAANGGTPLAAELVLAARHGQRPNLLQHSHDDVSRWRNQRNLDAGRRQRRSRTRNAIAGWRRHRGARRCQAPETRATVNLIQFDEL